MSDDAPTPGTRRRTWPRLAALLVLIVLASLVIAWMVQSEGVSATALFEVRNEAPSLVGPLPAQSSRESDFKILKNTQLALLKSKFVLTSALANPGIAALSVLAGKEDPVDWLQEHLEVGYPQNGEILEIKLRGTKSQADDLVHLVDAVADAYKKEVLGSDKSRQLAQRDMLERSLQNLNGEIKRKYEDYLDIAKGMGRPDGEGGGIRQQLAIKRLDRIDEELMQLERELLKMDAGSDNKDSKFAKQRLAQLTKRQEELLKNVEKQSEKSVELITRKDELAQLQRIADEMSIRLEQLDIDSEAPYRIRQVQRAVIEPAQIAAVNFRAD